MVLCKGGFIIMKKTPVIFTGHGSPMLAIDENDLTREMQRVGANVLTSEDKPKAILAISAHWYVPGTYIQSAKKPRQIYDMYGFPEELYQLQYPAKGCPKLTQDVCQLLGNAVSIDDSWGIDHGTWSVMVHMFPNAPIPVVQLSVNSLFTPDQCFALGQKLAPLREEGYLIWASGNIVHNLRRVEWNKRGGSEAAKHFNQDIVDNVTKGNLDAVIHYENHEHAAYAVPTPEHYLPLLYCLGAAGTDKATPFNNTCTLGSMAMTGFVWA